MASSIFGQQKSDNPLKMLGELKKFAAGITPQGAKNEVERLLASGRMTQEQFNSLSQKAEELMKMFK